MSTRAMKAKTAMKTMSTRAMKAMKAKTALKTMPKKGMKTMATKAMKSATKTNAMKAMATKGTQTRRTWKWKSLNPSATKTSAMKTMATNGTQTRGTWKWKSLSPRLTVRGDEDDEGHEVAQRRGQEEGSAVWLPEVVLGWEPIIVGWFWAPSGRPKFKYVMIEKESVEL